MGREAKHKKEPSHVPSLMSQIYGSAKVLSQAKPLRLLRESRVGS